MKYKAQCAVRRVTCGNGVISKFPAIRYALFVCYERECYGISK